MICLFVNESFDFITTGSGAAAEGRAGAGAGGIGEPVPEMLLLLVNFENRWLILSY